MPTYIEPCITLSGALCWTIAFPIHIFMHEKLEYEVRISMKEYDMDYSLKMNIDIRFNRNLTKEDYVIPGGYKMVFFRKSVQFDFQDYCGMIDSVDATILHCELKHPDFDAFEDFRTLTDKDLRNISEIIECYVYIGEECSSPLSEIEILSIAFELDNSDTVELNEAVIQNYNVVLREGRN